MNDENVINHYSVTDIAGSLSKLLDISPPAGAKTVIEPLVRIAGGTKAEKLLIYNPDAVAMWLWRKYPDSFLPVMRHTQLTLPLHTVMPSVTPVCFASIYTGLDPSEHGIQKYEKPVLTCDTLFDALVRAGKKVALAAVRECSMARIFLERGIDYFITESEEETTKAGLRAIESDMYDCIFIYHGSYDSTMHRLGVEDKESLETLDRNARDFDRFVTEAKKVWYGKTALYGWVTDHGAHNSEAGRGTHGTDMPDDLNITHFWGIDKPGNAAFV